MNRDEQIDVRELTETELDFVNGGWRLVGAVAIGGFSWGDEDGTPSIGTHTQLWVVSAS